MNDIIKWLAILNFLFIPRLSGYGQNNTSLMLVTSQRKVPQAEFLELFENMPAVKYLQVVQPIANEWIEQGKADEFDLWVFYDLNDSITESQKAAYWQALEKGQNMLFLHHSLPSYQAWPEFISIIGGRFHRAHPERGPSSYKHNMQIDVEVKDPSHPITKGLKNFTITDETYYNCEILPSVTPLLSTTNRENMPLVAWIHKVGRAEVVYIQLGHDQQAFNNPNFVQLLQQSVFYLASTGN